MSQSPKQSPAESHHEDWYDRNGLIHHACRCCFPNFYVPPKKSSVSTGGTQCIIWSILQGINFRKMKKHVIRPIALLATGLLWAGTIHAQESVNVAGGDATGAGGSVAYSVGQVVYTTATGATGSVAQGVQQPFEISVVIGVEEASIQLEVSAFPNPTTDFLTLKVNAFEGLNLQLTDLRGAVISSKNISEFNTIVSMEGLAKSIYFLTVSDENHIVKTFKISKI